MPLCATLRNAGQLNRRGVKTARGGEAGDFQTALKEWKPLADQGHAGAQYNLGLMYADGRGVPEDDAEAAGWLRLAASGPQYQR